MPDTATELGIGLHPGIPMDAYLTHPAISASGLEKLRRSALQYRYATEHEEEATDTLERGSALHMAVLEPEYFDGHYRVLGQCQASKRDGKRCSYQASFYRDGRMYCGTHDPEKGEPPDPAIVTLKEPDCAAVLGMRDAVLKHPAASKLFNGRGGTELTGIWEDAQSGVVCKIRPDRLVERTGTLVELKSARDAAPWAFPRDAANRGYHRKLVLYRRGLCALGWPYQTSVIAAVESTPPFDVACYLVAEEELDAAEREVERLLRQYRTCVDLDLWEGYSPDFIEMKLPAWATATEELSDV